MFHVNSFLKYFTVYLELTQLTWVSIPMMMMAFHNVQKIINKIARDNLPDML